MPFIICEIVGGLLIVGLFLYVIHRLWQQKKSLDEKTAQLNLDISALQKQEKDMSILVAELKSQQAALTDSYATTEALIQAKKELLNKDLQESEKNFQEQEDLLRQEVNDYYVEILQDASIQANTEISAMAIQIKNLEESLTDLQNKVNAAVAANKREQEKKDALDFYRLVLTEEDIKEIAKLREIIPMMRDKEVLNKVIYKTYYEKPYTDLIGRLFNSKSVCGIYKITNIDNGMCYVGQARDVGERFKQHIKKGVGADNPGNNKLYPAMYALGPENFTFELIEECDISLLDSREDYWQDYFHAKDFGYSIR